MTQQAGGHRSSLPQQPPQRDADQVVWNVNDSHGNVTAVLLEKPLNGLCFVFLSNPIQEPWALFLGQHSQTVVFESSRELTKYLFPGTSNRGSGQWAREVTEHF